MSENLRNYTKAVYGMDHVVRGVQPDQWDRPSPCEGWTAGDVLLHAAGVVRLVEAAARGAAPVPVSGEPAAAWAETRDAVLEALDHPHVLHTVVPSPFGEMPVDTLIGILMADTLTHTWDLARAVGGDDRLAPELVAVSHAGLLPFDEGLRAPGRFSPKVPDAPGDDAQTRFLKFLGRTP